MFRKQLIALPCRLLPGAFSGERVFEVQLADGKMYRSVAPRHFCWNSRGQLVRDNEPTTAMEGMVAARLCEQLDDDQFLVEVPDGKVIAVDRSSVRERPSEIRPPEVHSHVSVES